MSNENMKTACVGMTGPDMQMDLVGGNMYKSINPLPIKCSHCTFPDINFVAKPYLLTKVISLPVETSSAVLGNFFVRDRAKRWLAVPKHIFKTPGTTVVRPYCSKCGEPKAGYSYANDVQDRMKQFDTGGVDIFKTLAWSGATAEDDFEAVNRYRKEDGNPLLPWSHWGVESPPHPERWSRTMLTRDLYFSVRLDDFLKRAKVKGQLIRSRDFKEIQCSPEDEAWIEKKFNLLAEHGLVDAPKVAAGKSVNAAQKWFKQFLKKNAAKNAQAVGFVNVEKKHKLTLPQDYKDFIATVGPKSFKDVNDLEGSTTVVLLPQKLDFKDYRRGKVPDLESEDAGVDGVMFSATDFGDCFVFDVSVKGNDYPVYWYRHEENALEQFAPNFAECIQRFVQKN